MIEQFDEQGRPIRCKIGPATYEVIWVDTREFRSMNTTAQQDPIHQTLRIYGDMPIDGIAVDFVHEIYHATRYQSTASGTRDLTEEEAAQLAAVHLTAFWKDNPQIFAWWSKLIA